MLKRAKQKRMKRRRQGKKERIFHARTPLDSSDLHRAQQREVSKVLLDGLYDPFSPLSNLLGVRTEIVGEIIWQKMLVENWQIYPDQ